MSSPYRHGPPIARPSKIVCIGLNYRDHAAEIQAELPKEPIIFLKSTSAISGPYDELAIPRGSSKVDWEVELGVVIGSRTSGVTETRAADHIAGYLIVNDVSERGFQLDRGGQWVKGKSADGFAPLGPHFVTPEELADPHDLKVWLTVNGETMQSSSTSNMIFGIPQIISYVSQFMTLLPGDIISTGTPAGVGLGRKPQRYLKPGDVIEAGNRRPRHSSARRSFPGTARRLPHRLVARAASAQRVAFLAYRPVVGGRSPPPRRRVRAPAASGPTDS